MLQNQELSTEDDLTASVTESDRMRELQDKVAQMRAQVSHHPPLHTVNTTRY